MYSIDSHTFFARIKDSASLVLDKIYLQMPEIFYNNCINYLQRAQETNNKITWGIHDNSTQFVDYFVNYQIQIQKAEIFDREETWVMADLNAFIQFIAI